MYYRVKKVLDAGSKRGFIGAGSLTRLEWLNARQRKALLDTGAVTELKPPPLDQLPGCVTVARKLAPLGVVDAVQFVEANDAVIMQALGWKRRETVLKWKRRVEKYLVVTHRPDITTPLTGGRG